MFKIERTPKPEKYSIASDEFFEIMVKDCHDKCYICEQTDFMDAEKEHIVAREKNRDLKNDWNNILLSCSTCNGIKGTKHIIDCTNIDPQEYMELRYESNTLEFDEYILVDVKDKGKNIEFLYETIDILKQAYNSSKPANAKRATKCLRSKVNKDLAEFRKNIETYTSETDDILKKRHFGKIKQLIQLNVQFSAFKRQIIKDNEMLYNDFKGAL